MLRKWEALPKYMRTEAVWPYYNKLYKKRVSLCIKRGFDFVFSLFLLVLLSPVMIVLAIVIMANSKGGAFFCQERITQYGKKFRIFKFRTMVVNADQLGSQVTVKNDMRVTKVGKVLRKYRLDELPQLINILLGEMSFVGTRPEATKYVKKYQPDMFATLLLPAGVTSETSILFKNEEKMLANAVNIDEVYIKWILPEKMKYNLQSLEKFSLFNDVLTMIKTLIAVIWTEKIEGVRETLVEDDKTNVGEL